MQDWSAPPRKGSAVELRRQPTKGTNSKQMFEELQSKRLRLLQRGQTRVSSCKATHNQNVQLSQILLKSPLLDIFVKKIFSGVVPSERARTHDSEYVGHIGVQMIKTIVIAAQSQDRSAKVGSSRKIADVTKK